VGGYQNRRVSAYLNEDKIGYISWFLLLFAYKYVINVNLTSMENRQVTFVRLLKETKADKGWNNRRRKELKLVNRTIIRNWEEFGL